MREGGESRGPVASSKQQMLYLLGLNFFTNDGLWGKHEIKEMVLKNLLFYREDTHTPGMSEYFYDLR